MTAIRDIRTVEADRIMHTWEMTGTRDGMHGGMLALWLAGMDTMEIAEQCDVPEQEACRVLANRRAIHGTLENARPK